MPYGKGGTDTVFQSTLPLQGATELAGREELLNVLISIHTPLAGSDNDYGIK